MEMTTTQPRRRSIGARRNPHTETAIIEAARELLADRGYAGFSIEEAARRAGAGKATVYRWWPTKADLFMAAYGAEKARAISLPDTGSLVEDLVQHTADLWRFWRTPPGGAFRALLAEAQASEAAGSRLRNEFLPVLFRPARRLFERAAARGEFPARLIDERIALWAGFNWYHLLTWQIDADEALLRRIETLVASGANGAG
ncbi:TetR/AcrR family transcriptional regulator [Labrys neptuniae]